MRVLVLTCVTGCLAVLILGATSKSLTLPNELKTCKRGDDVCLAEAVTETLPVLVRGLPKFGVPTIDPLRIDEMVIDQGSGPVQLKMTVKNQNLTGLGRATVTGVRSQMTDTDFLLEINGTLPAVALTGDYSIAGKVLVLPIRGQGRNNFTLSDVTATSRMSGRLVKHKEDDKDEYLQLDVFDFDFSTSRLDIDLENLFNGDKRLGDKMVAFLNANWRVLLAELKPAVREAVSQLLMGIADRFFSRVPYAILFPKE